MVKPVVIPLHSRPVIYRPGLFLPLQAVQQRPRPIAPGKEGKSPGLDLGQQSLAAALQLPAGPSALQAPLQGASAVFTLVRIGAAVVTAAGAVARLRAQAAGQAAPGNAQLPVHCLTLPESGSPAGP